METSEAASRDGGAAPSVRSFSMRSLRRMSMEEDMFYREVMTSRPAQPPSYESALKAALAAQRRALAYDQGLTVDEVEDVLPEYNCDVHIEGVFMRKMEIEDTIKRAELRNWQMVYVVLHGTALNIYHVKKERSFWSTKYEGPQVQPDNPPWIKKGSLEKSYSLLHADAGIAADYRKRRYVIRMRAETDQFLLSCVELETFVTWLDRIFAAINIAFPIDNRTFPLDHSIPRIQRMRYLRGQRPTPDDSILGLVRTERRQSDASSSGTGRLAGLLAGEADEAMDEPTPPIMEEDNRGIGPSVVQAPVQGRLSTTSYPNEAVDQDTGKWRPRHAWTATHDLLYAKLCFSVLLFKSPRKSSYIISKGKLWHVDWRTGRMVRWLPPNYGEVELAGPWHLATVQGGRPLV